MRSWSRLVVVGLVTAAFATSPALALTLRGKVADGDITSGPGIAGASAQLRQGGTTVATVLSDAAGAYIFSGINAGDYTVRVTAAGFDDGECSRTIDASTETWWCSVALNVATPNPDPTDPDPTDPDPTDPTDPDPVDTGAPDTGASGLTERIAGRGPRTGCATAPGAGHLAWLGLLLVVGRRRRAA